MKALFAIRNVETGKLVKDLTFPNKLEAKQQRNKMYEEAGKPTKDDGSPNFPFVIAYGPDHDKFQR